MQTTGTLRVETRGDREIVMTRVFEAPAALVFDAFSRPELLAQWFGPRGWSLSACEVDLWVGGGWRFVMRGPDGTEMGMHGTYREIEAPGRSVHTEIFDDYAEAGESVVTSTFDEQGGKTTLTAVVEYPSEEVRDAVLATGMEHGAAESYDKLAELLAELAPAEARR
jgi:uncharacterized protein YndB with AHSA1/START domain